jgi:hypothetical protein
MFVEAIHSCDLQKHFNLLKAESTFPELWERKIPPHASSHRELLFSRTSITHFSPKIFAHDGSLNTDNFFELNQLFCTRYSVQGTMQL